MFWTGELVLQRRGYHRSPPTTHLTLTLEDVSDLFAAYKNFNEYRSAELSEEEVEACDRLELRLQAAVDRLQNKSQPTGADES